MAALAFLLSRPGFAITPDMAVAFDNLWRSTASGGTVDYALPYPKWQFLSYLCETQDLVLHGSQNADIAQVEPRQAHDVKAFSGQHAIYATTDGIWVLYFAILDRKRYPEMTLFNSCLHVRVPPGPWGEPLYFFSITQTVLQQRPWCRGAVYILPRHTFVQEPPQPVPGAEIVLPHWVGSQPTCPLAKLLVEPSDFPFLHQVHGHNNSRLVQLVSAHPEGFPWPEALES
jgi:hypothetical protein